MSNFSAVDSTLLEDWREFETNILPADFGVEQRRKTKFAFYTAATLVIDRLLQSEAGRLAESPAIDFIHQMKVECQALANSIAEDFHR